MDYSKDMVTLVPEDVEELEDNFSEIFWHGSEVLESETEDEFESETEDESRFEICDGLSSETPEEILENYSNSLQKRENFLLEDECITDSSVSENFDALNVAVNDYYHFNVTDEERIEEVFTSPEVTSFNLMKDEEDDLDIVQIIHSQPIGERSSTRWTQRRERVVKPSRLEASSSTRLKRRKLNYC